MCEMIAGAGGCVAVDVDCLAAMSGPVALQAVRLILPEGALRHISFSVDGLRGKERNKAAVIALNGAVFLLVLELQCSKILL